MPRFQTALALIAAAGCAGDAGNGVAVQTVTRYPNQPLPAGRADWADGPITGNIQHGGPITSGDLKLVLIYSSRRSRSSAATALSCERMNRMLDRALVVRVIDQTPGLAFFGDDA
jgi:hypothetical protein